MSDFHSFNTQYGAADELYRTVMSLDKARVEQLKKDGAALTEEVKQTLVSGGGRFTSSPKAEFWYRYISELAELSKENFVYVSRVFREETGAPLYYSDMFGEVVIRGSFYEKEVFICLAECYDLKKLNKKRTMQEVIRQNKTELLAVCESCGWLKQTQKRDEMIEYSQAQERPECTAWLLDFKNRTADLAAERAKTKKKEERELNADPDSVTALKLIWSYTKLKDGTLRVTNYKGRQTEVAVPEKIGKSRVSAIGSGAFSGDEFDALRADPRQVKFRRTISKISLPDGITNIGEYAFSCIEKMRSMELPASVCRIGEMAFSDCCSLEKIVFSGGEVTVGDYAMCDCEALREVIFAEGTTKIRFGDQVFMNCEKLKKVVLPSTLKEIYADGEELFEDSPGVCVMVSKGSFAENFCRKNKLKFKYSEDL